ncbi:MAG: ribonuclease P protein component [Syntrophaceae bacterium]|jgi:ribonuclease P protein component|nr:ribonuclease P protein component [Syntrophaceae bacterium]
MALNAFRKEERIRKRADFLRVLKKGAPYRTPHFRVLVSPNGLSHCRLGITAGKKIGSAVRRNLLKRRIREFFRLNKDRFPVSSDFLIIAQEGAAKLSFWQLSEELKGLFRGESPPFYSGC